jgi:hypothetical protein
MTKWPTPGSGKMDARRMQRIQGGKRIFAGTYWVYATYLIRGSVAIPSWQQRKSSIEQSGSSFAALSGPPPKHVIQGTSK